MTNKHQHERAFFNDLPAMLARRKVLLGLGSLGSLGLIGLGLNASGLIGRKNAPMQTATAADGTSCVSDPFETEGPFPADGTNTKAGKLVNVLTKEGVIRPDLTTSFAGMKPVAAGLPLSLEIKLVNVSASCAPLAGYPLYLWHCDVKGNYSLYDQTDRNYLRGVGISDQNGLINFKTIFPGCYPGRWPHMHFEVFENATSAVSGSKALLTAQLAMPEKECHAAYQANQLYTDSIEHLKYTSLERDGIFNDNTKAQREQQTLTMQGDATTGYTANVTVGLKLS